MFKIDVTAAGKLLCGVFCVAGAVWVVWKGNAYGDHLAGNYSLVPPLMCSLCAFPLSLTGLALIFRPGDYSEE